MTPLELFETEKLVTICAPMVRYSKLPFRRLVRKYGCHLCFTPMIVADSFIKSELARHSDFTYSSDDHPLIVQFAANNPSDFVSASMLVHPYCNGVDLNCGCPQRWAMQEGYGACLSQNPELVADIVRTTRNTIPDSDFTVSIKIRIQSDIRKTVDFARQMEATGLSFISVHGRTKEERTEPVHYDFITAIKDALRIPVVANGDIKTLEDAINVQERTGVDGVMAARGLLANPALYSGAESTPIECVVDWIRIALETGTPFTCFHNHLIYMLEKAHSRADRRYFNALGSVPAVLEFLNKKYDLDL